MNTIPKYAILLPLIVGLSLSACGNSEQTKRLDELKQQSKANFIYLPAGTFDMGDFGIDKDGIHYKFTLSNDNPPHQVTLSAFSLAKYKVTWSDYETYLLATGKPVQNLKYPEPGSGQVMIPKWEGSRVPYQKNRKIESGVDKGFANEYYYKNPASVMWQDAKDYCHWLGTALNLPIDLATEAQWEYAARSGGKKIIYPNAMGNPDDPKPDRDIDKEQHFIGNIFDLVPIGTISTPSYLGFYDMDNNGLEWVSDWYSASYYTDYPAIKDPKGPEVGERKVVRGDNVTMSRFKFSPTNISTFRCAVQSEQPVTH